MTVTHSLFDADGNERCIQVRGYPVCVGTDKASYVLETCRDITELALLEESDRKTLEQQLREHKSQLAKMSAALEAERAKSRMLEETLRETQHHLSRLLAAAQTYMYTVHYENGEPQSTDHGKGCSAVTGYTQDDYESDRYLWITMVHTSDQDMVKEHVRNIFATEDMPKLEHRIARKDGTTRWVRNTIVKDVDETNQVLRYHGLIQDITDLKEVQSSFQEKKAQLLAAQEIQEHLLPTIAPNLPGFDIAGRLYPAEFTAGDCFDYLFMPDGSLAFAVCDVSGHDFGAALLMASLSAHLRWLAQTRTDVAEVLGLANLILVNDAEDSQFSSLLLARLDVEARHLVYANAGHPTGYVLDSTGVVKQRLESSALPLGIESDTGFPASDPVRLEPGDIIILLTDGAIETASTDGSQFGSERVLEVVRANRGRSSSEIIDRLYCAVCEFCKPNKPLDDVTFLVVKVNLPP
jgi:PAS domain S-box-containing protein